MSNAPYHASSAFVLGGSLLLLQGSMGPEAMAASVISVLLDSDVLISPDRDREHALHSSYALGMILALTAISFRVDFLAPYPAMALAAFASHLMLDLLRGEPLHHHDPLFGRFDLGRLERPRLANAMELLSLPAAVLLMVV